MRFASLALAAALPLALSAFVAVPTAHAQTVGARQRLVLTDGRSLVGTVVEVRDDAVVIDVRGVRSEVPRAQIARAEDPGRFDTVDPLGTRLFLTPTARTMPKGSVRISTVYYVVPNAAVGLTGNLDASLTATIPTSEGGLVSGNLKFAPLQSERLAVAVGASLGTVYGEGADTPLAGTIYGVATLGDVRQAVTLGVYGLYAGYEGDFELNNGMGVVVGAEKQVSNRLKLITENAVAIPFDDNDGTDPTASGVLTAGVRFFSERLAADVSYPFVTFDGGKVYTFQIPIPLVSFSYTIR